MSGVFEIREYLDEQGQSKNNEVVDITAELERFAKMGGDFMEKQEALDVGLTDVSFIDSNQYV